MRERLRLKVVLPLALLLLGGVLYTVVLAKSPEDTRLVEGPVYVLPKEFVLNLDDGRYAKLGVALVLEKGAVIAGAEGTGNVKPPEGFGPLNQEPLVRDIVTDTVTEGSADDLTDRGGRRELKRRILEQIHTKTDVAVTEVLFMDVAVQ